MGGVPYICSHSEEQGWAPVFMMAFSAAQQQQVVSESSPQGLGLSSPLARFPFLDT